MQFPSFDGVRVRRLAGETPPQTLRRAGMKPGSFCWGAARIEDRDVVMLWAVSPIDVPAHVRGIPVVLEGEPHLERQASWTWDGDRERPTLDPSLDLRMGPGDACVWHGHLRAGRWEACE